MAAKLGAVKRDLAALGFVEIGGSMVKGTLAIQVTQLGPKSDGKVKLTITDNAETREAIITRQSQLARALQG